MLTDGSQALSTSSTLTEVNIEHGATLPVADLTEARLFYLDTDITGFNHGLYAYHGSAWELASSTQVSYGTSFPSSPLDKQPFYLTALSGSSQAGLYLYDLATTTWLYSTNANFVPENSGHKDAASGYAGLDSSTLLKVAEFPAFTGDVTTSAGSVATTLATVNSNVGTFDTVTVNAKGLVTAASTKAGVANGLATLDGSGKLTSSQIPSSLVGAVVYQGAWNASTNSPALASGTGTKGYYYVTSTAGTTSIDGHASWNAGDVIIFDGTTWDKIDGVNSEVLSVAGRTGTVTLASGDISGLVASATTDTTNAANISSGTLPSGRLPALTGDVTTTAGTAATTLATVNSNVGTFNGITVNAKGLVTAASNQSYLTSASSITASQLPALTGDVTTTAGTVATTVSKINGTSLSALASGILYNTTSTGVPSIATATQIGTALGATATPTASTVAKWDANSNLSANNIIESSATTSASTVTLTVASAYLQFFTGTTSTYTLPVVSTLVLGQQYQIVNNGSGTVTVQSSGANTVYAIPAGMSVVYTCIAITGTSNTSWSYAASGATNATQASFIIGATATPAASTVPTWDANKNLNAANFIEGYSTTVTSGSTLALTASSNFQQYLTGSTAQTVTLPSNAALGQQWIIANASSAPASIQSSAGGAIVILPASTQATFTCLSANGTTAGSWSYAGTGISNNLTVGYATTATAAGTTTLTSGSAYQQYFTGSSTQTVQLPLASTLILGQGWNIVNNSTGAVTVQSSGGNTIVVIAAGASAILTCILISGTTAASWSYQAMAPATAPTFGTSLVSGTTNGQQYYLTAVYTSPASGNPTGTTISTVYPVGLYIYDSGNTTWRAALPILSTPYDLSAYVPGTPTASADILIFVATRAFTIPASFAGSVAKSLTAATASTVYQLQQNGSNVSNGTITFAASGTSATFGSIAATSVAVGDIISIVAPATPDSTHANISFTLLANLTQAT